MRLILALFLCLGCTVSAADATSTTATTAIVSVPVTSTASVVGSWTAVDIRLSADADESSRETFKKKQEKMKEISLVLVFFADGTTYSIDSGKKSDGGKWRLEDSVIILSPPGGKDDISMPVKREGENLLMKFPKDPIIGVLKPSKDNF